MDESDTLVDVLDIYYYRMRDLAHFVPNREVAAHVVCEISYLCHLIHLSYLHSIKSLLAMSAAHHSHGWYLQINIISHSIPYHNNIVWNNMIIRGNDLLTVSKS